MNERLIAYLESSFIGSLLLNEEITDVSYNGKNVFYMNNKTGRQKANIYIEREKVSDFIRQISNLSEKQFSFSEPFLDISVGRYRINAVHSSISKVNGEKAVSFSIRIASKNNRIRDDGDFITQQEKEYLLSLLAAGESIIIAGATGSGKTELQKYLLFSLMKNTRIIIIDNVQELECLRESDDLDLTYWQVSTNQKDKGFEDLIRNALRSNPDWLIISESRGKEMSDILLSVMSGHPIISTIHAYSIEEVPNRLVRMIQLANQNQQYEDILKDVSNHLKNYVFVKRYVDEHNLVHRYISSIGKYEEGRMRIIFSKKENNHEKI